MLKLKRNTNLKNVVDTLVMVICHTHINKLEKILKI